MKATQATPPSSLTLPPPSALLSGSTTLSSMSYEVSNEGVDDAAALSRHSTRSNGSQHHVILPGGRGNSAGEHAATDEGPPGTPAEEPLASTLGLKASPPASTTDNQVEGVFADANATSRNQNRNKTVSSRPGTSSSKESLTGSREHHISPTTSHKPASILSSRMMKMRSPGSHSASSDGRLSAFEVLDPAVLGEAASALVTPAISSSSMVNVEHIDENEQMLEGTHASIAQDASRKRRRFRKIREFLTMNAIRSKNSGYVEQLPSDGGSTAVGANHAGGSKAHGKISMFTLSGLRTRLKRPGVTTTTFQEGTLLATPEIGTCPPNTPQQPNSVIEDLNVDNLQPLRSDDSRKIRTFLKSESATNITPLRRLSNYASMRRSSSPLPRPQSMTVFKSSTFGPSDLVADGSGAGTSKDHADGAENVDVNNDSSEQPHSPDETSAGKPDLSRTGGRKQKHKWLPAESFSKLIHD